MIYGIDRGKRKHIRCPTIRVRNRQEKVLQPPCLQATEKTRGTVGDDKRSEVTRGGHFLIEPIYACAQLCSVASVIIYMYIYTYIHIHVWRWFNR